MLRRTLLAVTAMASLTLAAPAFSQTQTEGSVANQRGINSNKRNC